MIRWPWSKATPELRKLREPIQRHLGVDLVEAHSIAHEIKAIQRVNLQRVLDRWTAAANPPVQAFGFSSAGYLGDEGLVKYLITDELIQAPLERTQLDSGPEETLDCVLRGLFLFHRDKVPVMVAFRPPRYPGEVPVMEVIASTREAASGTLSAMLDEAQETSVYKGRTLSLEQSVDAWRAGVSIRFHEIRPTRREDIVLPDELIRLIERNVLGMLRHAEALRAAGRSVRRGLLFHGPPGTGKTLVIRYLTQASPDHTIILLNAAQQGLIREACQIARMLAPSIVVLEDVDLVAEEREQNRCPVTLHELMNEMDGLAPREEVTFLLTTNRPEILEPALCARPGRIDQAIAFPLPDDGCRRRLFEVYGRGLDLSAVDLARWVGQTNGVSPAFIEELLRKAALLAAERGET
ncbi:MAG TPA: AAA family ATPase, partial [Gemmataceae bacterium]|nr:AAA family ATPase [Gemmataceae bacterium]